MPKIFVIALLVAVIVVAESSPAKRVTCDLFGSDALCAAHCYGLNRQGGWCDSHRVCHCRSEHIVGKRDVAKRVTCDVFGSDALCAAHCYTLNRQGGWCDSHRVCHCRSEHIVGK